MAKNKGFDSEHRPDYLPEQDPNIDIESNLFPEIKVLQALSPELDEDEEKYVPNAKAGDLLVTTNPPRLVKGSEGIQFIPLATRKKWYEFVPRSHGGGFVADYNSKSEMEDGYTKGNDITVSVEILCLLQQGEGPNEPSPVVMLRFNTPTKMAPARKFKEFVERYKTLNGLIFKVTAVKQQNKQQQTFYNFKVEPVGWVPKELYSHVQQIVGEETPAFLTAPDSDQDGLDI